MIRITIFVALSLAVLAMVGLSYGQPPAGTDPNSPISKWFQGLTDPISHGSCCSEADCRPTEAHQTKNGHWEALVTRENYPQFSLDTDKWVIVPDNRVLIRTENPTGRPVLCWNPAVHFGGFTSSEPTNGVLCFVVPEES